MGLWKRVAAAIITSGGSEDRMVKNVRNAFNAESKEKRKEAERKEKEAEDAVKEGVSGFFGSDKDKDDEK
jgi:hypothetical protein